MEPEDTDSDVPVEDDASEDDDASETGDDADDTAEDSDADDAVVDPEEDEDADPHPASIATESTIPAAAVSSFFMVIPLFLNR
ncbi:MAG: hypothetical protein U0L49_08360 [Eubacterium sp.]|nr:hypothetical protein [Eubacterium sp.]